MKIEGGSRTSPAGAAPRAQGAVAPGFSANVAGPREAAPTGPAAALASVSSLDALLALQEAPGPMERRRRAVKRAGRLLDLLDSVKLTLLEGGSASATLSQLQMAVREARGETDDPGLEGVLNEIDTRAAVELAKEEILRSTSVQAV